MTSDPTTQAPWGWQPVHVGTERDGLTIDGLDIWALRWHDAPEGQCWLPHPAHPDQQHLFTIHSVEDGRTATTFAAAEVSNGVWGFYRWIVPADAAAGRSADGSLRYQHDLGPFSGGRYDAVAPVARLFETADGAPLFDGDAWTSSRIVPQADGALLLVLKMHEDETIFRIEPATGQFRDLAEREAWHPLRGLTAAAAAAHEKAETRRGRYLDRRVAPDGSMVVLCAAAEWANSHWVASPRVISVADDAVLLDLWGNDWDAAISFPRRGAVRLALRRYTQPGRATLELDLASSTCRIVAPAGVASANAPIAQAPSLAMRAMRSAAPAATDMARPPMPVGRGFTARSARVALLILIGAAVAVAAIVFVIESNRPPSSQRLTPLPAGRPTLERTR
ncbi:hypothetical protein FHS96_003184 [Sphingomonas zeicaulis]|uniref:hypothetical protein n=1 Tax=Sphingomonas zeicaulis TaxID=1632740 RepID=UPI003D1DF178